MKCDVCGSDNLEGAAYCEDCGAKLVVAHAVPAAAVPAAMVPAPVASAPAPPPPPPPPPAAVQASPAGATATQQCPSCAADNPPGEQYCVDCGANLGPAPAAAPAVAPVVAPVVAAPAARPSARLLLPASNKEYRLDRDLTTMGRRSPADQIEPDVDLTDDDPESYVSRRHGQIIRSAGAYVFEDVGSSNGSFVNNVKVQPGVQQSLHDGDRIRLGKTEFVFHP